MSLRRVIVEADPKTLNVTKFCRDHGISTWFFYDLRRRHGDAGDAVLEPQSRAPHTVANKTPVEIEDLIVAKRKELDDAGWDAGAGTIAIHLGDVPGLPHESTIWRILRARGFVKADPSKAPKRSGHRFNAERANESWQLDDTGWELADNTEVKIFDVLDDHSRLAVACQAMDTCTGAEALKVVTGAAETWGLPERIQSDNAAAFRHVLAGALGALGVAAAHSRPYHPQTNGKVERFHQTVKHFLRKQPRAATRDELQAQLDFFRHTYNHHRPHRGVARRFPADVWAEAPKSGPAPHPLGTPTTVSHSIVRDGKAAAGDYLISTGTRHNGARALTVITGLACHVFIEGQLIRQLTIDPNRRVQPIHPTRGRPPTTVREDPRHA